MTICSRIGTDFSSTFRCPVRFRAVITFGFLTVLFCRGEKELREIERDAADAQRMKDAQER